MTFSICVREEYTDDGGADQTRFGVAVTTRLPGVGTLCPFVSENGAVATQSLVNVRLGRKGIEYIDDGLSVTNALQSLLDADEGAPQRQLHGVDADGKFTFSGEECKPWYGHTSGTNYTVAGNLLTGESVIDAVAETYESDAFGDRPLAERLIDALEAGHAEGGDKREELPVQSAALLVSSTEDREFDPYYNDLRVDATETPIEDLRETFQTARRGQEIVLEQYDDSDDTTSNTDDATSEHDATGDGASDDATSEHDGASDGETSDDGDDTTSEHDGASDGETTEHDATETDDAVSATGDETTTATPEED